MKDRLEQFIDENRDEFDLYEPSQEVWDKIVKRKPETKTKYLNWKSIAWKAAAVLVIFMASFAVQEYLHRNDNGYTSLSKQNEIIIPELVEAEMYYNTQVNNRLLEVKQYTSSNPELDKQLKTDLSQLDSICAELKNDLKDEVANEEVVNAMIQNYRLKLQILENLLYKLQKSKQKKLDKNENKKEHKFEL